MVQTPIYLPSDPQRTAKSNIPYPRLHAIRPNLQFQNQSPNQTPNPTIPPHTPNLPRRHPTPLPHRAHSSPTSRHPRLHTLLRPRPRPQRRLRLVETRNRRGPLHRNRKRPRNHRQHHSFRRRHRRRDWVFPRRMRRLPRRLAARAQSRKRICTPTSSFAIDRTTLSSIFPQSKIAIASTSPQILHLVFRLLCAL